jgi:hypothetical protein
MRHRFPLPTLANRAGEANYSNENATGRLRAAAAWSACWACAAVERAAETDLLAGLGGLRRIARLLGGIHAAPLASVPLRIGRLGLRPWLMARMTQVPHEPCL